MKKIFSFLSITFILLNCDPARILVVKAANEENTSVTVYADKSILPGYEDATEKIMIHMPQAVGTVKYDTTFFYGLGTWADDSLMPGFASQIDSIVIVASAQEIHLNTQADITDYLLRHRNGFAKHRLTIEAK